MSAKCPTCAHPEHPGRRCQDPLLANVGDDIHHRLEIVDFCGCDAWNELLAVVSHLEATLRRWMPGNPAPEPCLICDCPMDPHHRWNCALTPIWAQTIRDLNKNPWTVLRPGMRWGLSNPAEAFGGER